MRALPDVIHLPPGNQRMSGVLTMTALRSILSGRKPSNVKGNAKGYVPLRLLARRQDLRKGLLRRSALPADFYA